MTFTLWTGPISVIPDSFGKEKHGMAQLLTAYLADRRQQLWFLDDFGSLTGRSQTSPQPNATWTAWDNFSSPPLAVLKSIAAGSLPQDHRLQLWAIDTAATIWNTTQISTDPEAGWTDWVKFDAPTAAGNLVGIAAAPLDDGRLQVWIVQALSEVWTMRMASQDINDGWTTWTQLAE